MENDQPKNFKIGAADERTESYIADFTDQRVARINQRLTLVSILVPCMLLVIILLVYLNMKKQVVYVEGSGAKELQHLAESFESSHAALTVRHAKLQESLEKQQSETAALQARLEKRLAAFDTALAELSAAKADQKKVAQSLSALSAELKKTNTALDTAGAEWSKRMDQTAAALESQRQDIRGLKNGLTQLSTDVVDSKSLKIALDTESKKRESQLDAAVAAFEKKIAETLSAVDDLDRRLTRQSKAIADLAARPVAPAFQPEPTKKPISEPSAPTPPTIEKPPAPGKIIEEDLP